MADRFVILGVSRARSPWFRAVAQWATSAAVPAEFVKCVSVEEVLAHLGGARRFSVALLDGALPAVDRDVIAAARDAGCPVVVVHDGRRQRDWPALGAAGVLPATFDREQLLDVLAAHAVMLGDAGSHPATRTDGGCDGAAVGSVVAVCGPGGTGVSTAAMALAEEMGRRRDDATRPVVLADLALHAEQAMLHDVRDIVPGVADVVEAHRSRSLDPSELLGLTFAIEGRSYRLLLGLRRARYWATLRPHAFEAAFTSLRRTFATVVCDITADFETEQHGGSIDVEERTVMSRTALAHAEVVLVVGAPGTKGLHALVRVLVDVLDAGVGAARVVPVVNLAPRSPRRRAQITAAVGALAGAHDAAAALSSPIYLPQRRVDAAIRDGAPMPAPLGRLLAGAVDACSAQHSRRLRGAAPQPELVAPGSIGSWSPQEWQ